MNTITSKHKLTKTLGSVAGMISVLSIGFESISTLNVLMYKLTAAFLTVIFLSNISARLYINSI